MDTRSQAEELAKRPYLKSTSLQETTDDEPIYFARVLEIDGCFGQGKTLEEAQKDLELAMVDFIESLIQDGLEVPEPSKLVKSSRPIDTHRLTNTSVSTSSGKTITFAGQGNRWQPKRTETHVDAYLLVSST
jgi:predicted RNase H-like HicB family nuclease